MIYIKVDFENTRGVKYTLTFDWLTYTGAAEQFEGRCSIDYPTVDDILEPIRGSQLQSTILCDTNRIPVIQALSDLEGDKEVKVVLTREGLPNQIEWTGWLIPDGISYSFVTDFFDVNLTAIDGLGILENTTYATSTGQAYSGNEQEFQILRRCLELTGLNLEFTIFDFNLFFGAGAIPTLNIANKPIYNTYVNQDRYKTDNTPQNLFSARRVLEAVLLKYGAIIVQEDNRWNIFRLAHIHNGFTAGIIFARTFDAAGTEISSGDRDTNRFLGSQITGTFQKVHAQADQNVEFRGSLGGYKVNYKYGFLKSVVDNPTVRFIVNPSPPPLLNLPFWTEINFGTLPEDQVVADTLAGGDGSLRAIIQAIESPGTPSNVPASWDRQFQSVLTGNTTINPSQSVSVQLEYRLTQQQSRMWVYFEVKYVTPSQTYWLDETGWITSFKLLLMADTTTQGQGVNQSNYVTSRIISPQVPGTQQGEIQVVLGRPYASTVQPAPLVENNIIYRNVVISGNVDTNIKGESHQITRTDNGIRKVALTEDVYVGDNPSDIYIGAIETVTNEQTVIWGKAIGGLIVAPALPLLRWLVTDRMLLQYKNQIQFTGGIYERLKYVGRLRIDTFLPRFTTIGLSYDVRENTCRATHRSISTTEFSTLNSTSDYVKEFEGDLVVKPTIVG